ncbi:hypothetical protein [Neorhizobium alkalisoli]|uniref:Uncharacterized protein n=1 Tax=Neorhizobium alkalisoli TaxID=528178 RepID=A0A561QWM3_9HYPH|nr:hypothetical protein [Neorhizobium alkalisoli]TWF54742.1 hypothetical protein FHW37_103612 [Neorhizobium alkalisoli]
MDLADLDLTLIFKRIDVERKKDTDIREILVIVREMLESQRQARDAPPSAFGHEGAGKKALDYFKLTF